MGYMHIENLYKNRDILLFKECWALEKVHGTSAHIANICNDCDWDKLYFFSGGVSHDAFVKLFNETILKEKLAGINCTIYGEAYGGSCQKMSDVYGKDLKFIAFDVKINDVFLAVPQAEAFVLELGLEFVDYAKVPTELSMLDFQRDMCSVQAIRNGMGNDKEREGVVLRPIMEFTKNNGDRVICKHKREKFRETSTPRPVSAEMLKVLEDANEIANEWVTPIRLQHVLDKIENVDISKMSAIIRAMQEDVQREGVGELVWTNEVAREVAKKTAELVKTHFSIVKV